VSDSSGLKDRIPPGFEGQCRRCDHVTKKLNTTEGQEGKHETFEPTFPQQTPLVAPLFESPSGPYLDVIQANPLANSTKSYSQHELFLKQENHMTHGPMLANISNHQITKQGSLGSRPKWSRVLRPSPGSKEALLVHAGQKRVFVRDSDQVEAPNKKYIVSQDDKENSDVLVAAGSQPCYRL